MLVEKDHVGGEGSCWWRRIMLVGKDHAGAARSLLLQNYDLGAVKNGLGVYILTTNKGLLTDKQAKASNVGGEIICEVF